MIRASRESGFTLLELLVTVAVIMILAAIAVPSFFSETRKTKARSEVEPMFSDMRTRFEEYLQERGTYPPTVGESTWNPAGPPSSTRVPLDLSAAGWSAIKLRPSGDISVLCRYTFATGTAGDATGIGPQASAVFGFTAPSTGWYYLLAKCDMDGDASSLSWYFSSSVDSTIRKDGEGQ